MGLQIEGGTGNGYSAGVNAIGQLTVETTTITKEHEVNHNEGQAYSLPVSVTPTAAGDCFLYLRNNSDSELIVSEIALTAATTETISIKLGDGGIPIGGNTTTPVNRNAGSGNQADVTAQSGVDITGLSGGSVVFGWTVEGGVSTQRVVPASGFILPKNKVLTAYVATGGIAISLGLGISFHMAHGK